MKRIINYFKYAPVYRHVVVGLMALVVFVTTYAMILPAISLEWEKRHAVSGLQAETAQVQIETMQAETAHDHDDACYALVPVLDEDGKETGTWQQVLICTIESIEE